MKKIEWMKTPFVRMGNIIFDSMYMENNSQSIPQSVFSSFLPFPFSIAGHQQVMNNLKLEIWEFKKEKCHLTTAVDSDTNAYNNTIIKEIYLFIYWRLIAHQPHKLTSGRFTSSNLTQVT